MPHSDVQYDVPPYSWVQMAHPDETVQKNVGGSQKKILQIWLQFAAAEVEDIRNLENILP